MQERIMIIEFPSEYIPNQTVIADSYVAYEKGGMCWSVNPNIIDLLNEEGRSEKSRIAKYCREEKDIDLYKWVADRWIKL